MPHENPPRLFCFGLGYSARALADGLQGEGWRIAGTNRRPENASSGGRELFAFDGTTPLQGRVGKLAPRAVGDAGRSVEHPPRP